MQKNEEIKNKNIISRFNRNKLHIEQAKIEHVKMKKIDVIINKTMQKMIKFDDAIRENMIKYHPYWP